jgi:hypothetical protein
MAVVICVNIRIPVCIPYGTDFGCFTRNTKYSFNKSYIMKTSKMDQLLSEMRSEARAHNRFLTTEYLKTLEPRVLISLTQPSSRRDYHERLNLLERATPNENKVDAEVAELSARGEFIMRSSRKSNKSYRQGEHRNTANINYMLE